MWKNTGYWPHSWGAYEKDDFSEPKLLCLLIHRKALNSFSWDICFFFFNHKNPLDVQTTRPLLQLLYNMGLPRCCYWQRICWAMQKTQELWVQSLGQEDALEKEMATHCTILTKSRTWASTHITRLLLPLSPPWSSNLRVTWDAAFRAWSPKNFHWVKT